MSIEEKIVQYGSFCWRQQNDPWEHHIEHKLEMVGAIFPVWGIWLVKYGKY